jgi:Na+/melibiose symporter-like transporter
MVATALVGLLMGASGYDGLQEIQPAGTNAVIVALNSVIPAILCAVQLVLLKFYDLDTLLPQMRKELKEKASSTTNIK